MPTETSLMGAAIVALPLILLAALMLWRNYRAVFFFAVVAIFVGVGYLIATDATTDIALMIMRDLPTPPPAIHPAPTP